MMRGLSDPAVGEAEHVRVDIVVAEGTPKYATAGLSLGPAGYHPHKDNESVMTR
jgi:hypothetical protein